MIAIVTVGIRY